MEKTTFEDLATIITANYIVNARRSLPRMKTSLSALRAFFGPSYARDLTLDRLDAYVASRLNDGVAPASIRNDLASNIITIRNNNSLNVMIIAKQL